MEPITLKTAETLETYQEMVDQALFEVDDLRAAIEYDDDSEMSPALKFIDDVEQDLRALAHQIRAGTYTFNDEDLPFMATVMKQPRHIVPFRSLLQRINETHRKGLDQVL